MHAGPVLRQSPKNRKPEAHVSTRPPDLERRLRTLSERELDKCKAAQARVDMRCHVPLSLKERFMSLAELHIEDLSVVMRVHRIRLQLLLALWER